MVEILFVYPHESPFIRSDFEILSGHFSVESFRYERRSDLISFIPQFAKSTVVFSWFALGYAMTAAALSLLTNHRTILVTGGWDVATVPEISYGLMLSSRRRWRIVAALSLTDKVLAISESIASDVKRWAPRSAVAVCPLGFDAKKYFPNGEKVQKVLTVGNVTRENMLRKGLTTYVEAARSMPDVKFVLVGAGESDLLEELRRKASPNLTVAGYLPDTALLREMQSASVYAQLSAHEGFGCALAEAMLCGCVPVVTNRGAIPEVVGDTGFYVQFGNVEVTVRALRQALADRDGRNARERIRARFSLEARDQALVHEVNRLLERNY